MPTGTEPFDMQATASVVWNALCAVVCNVGFQVAATGLVVASIIALLAFTSLKNGKRTGKPLLSVSRKIGIFCLCLGIPGAICLIASHHLPQVNQLVINPLGLFGLWGLITAHLCMEEMNFQWYADK